MRLARIRTSDPEAVAFLASKLAASGFRLEFVKEGEQGIGKADIEVTATRMDIEQALQTARGLSSELGTDITILPGVFVPKEAAPPREARTEELQPEPIPEPEQAALFEEPEAESVSTRSDYFIPDNPTQHPPYAEVSPYARGAEFDDEPSRFGAFVNNVGNSLAEAIYSFSQAANKNSTRVGLWTRERFGRFRQQKEEKRRELAANMARIRQETEERRRVGLERFEVLRRQEEARKREAQERVAPQPALPKEPVRFEPEIAPSSAEPKPVYPVLPTKPAEVPVTEPRVVRQPALRPAVSEPVRAQTNLAADRSRERTFRRAGVAAALVAAAVVGLWGLAQVRRPADPLNGAALMRSAAVRQTVPFGPAITTAPVVRPAAIKSVPARTATPVKKHKKAVKKPTAAVHSAKATKPKHRASSNEVTVRHFDSKKQQARTKTKEGVKIIAED